MMSFASGDLSKLQCRAKFSIKHVTLFLSASILPIRTKRMSKGILCKLINQSLFRLQAAKQLLTCLTPINTSMLLASSRDAFYSLKWRSLVLQPLENNIHGFQPHGYRSVYRSRCLLNKDTFLSSILRKICIKVRLCFIQDSQFRSDNNCYRMSAVP